MRGAVHTNGMENFWALFKRCVKGTHVSVEPFHLEAYVDAEAFRFNMRAIHTVWENTLERRAPSRQEAAGIYVNMALNTSSKWGQVVSFMPDAGRVTVKATMKDTYFVRPPHWVDHDEVRAFVGVLGVPVTWAGAYVRFDAAAGDELTITYPLAKFTQEVHGLWKHSAAKLNVKFEWLGNMVIASEPAATKTPLYTGLPRQLPPVAAAP